MSCWRRENGSVGAEIIIHLWVSDLVLFYLTLSVSLSPISTKVAAPTLENGTRLGSFDHALFWVTQAQVKKRHSKLKGDIIYTYKHEYTLKY